MYHLCLSCLREIDVGIHVDVYQRTYSDSLCRPREDDHQGQSVDNPSNGSSSVGFEDHIVGSFHLDLRPFLSGLRSVEETKQLILPSPNTFSISAADVAWKDERKKPKNQSSIVKDSQIESEPDATASSPSFLTISVKILDEMT